MLKGRASRRGQATTEYILIVVLVAILSIGIITIFGDAVRDLFGVSAERLAGETDAKLDPSVTQGVEAATQQTIEEELKE